MTIQDIARVCHEANRAYCVPMGKDSQLPHWDEAPQWQRDSCTNGVRFHLANPDAGPAASHESWLREKVAAGWTYGPEKDAELKLHPCVVPFDQLPEAQQAKDVLFGSIVSALAPLLQK